MPPLLPCRSLSQRQQQRVSPLADRGDFPPGLGRGSLRPGACADIAAFQLESGRFDLEDSLGEIRTAEQRLVPRIVVRAGRIVRDDSQIAGS